MSAHARDTRSINSGTTIDFAQSSAPPWDGNFGATPTGRWLARNAADFGFLMSYPKGASERHLLRGRAVAFPLDRA